MTPTETSGSLVVPANGFTVSTLLLEPDEADTLLVLGHGAGAGMRHPHMEAIATSLAAQGVATLRYQFPSRERGGGRDSREVTFSTIEAAVDMATRGANGRRLFLGGHSFGGRMGAYAAAQGLAKSIEGLIFFSFPLHPPRKISDERLAPMAGLAGTPMLFLSGSRDALADLSLLQKSLASLDATLVVIETADHGFKVLKRTRTRSDTPYEEAASAVRSWLDR